MLIKVRYMPHAMAARWIRESAISGGGRARESSQRRRHGKYFYFVFTLKEEVLQKENTELSVGNIGHERDAC